MCPRVTLRHGTRLVTACPPLSAAVPPQAADISFQDTDATPPSFPPCSESVAADLSPYLYNLLWCCLLLVL